MLLSNLWGNVFLNCPQVFFTTNPLKSPLDKHKIPVPIGFFHAFNFDLQVDSDGNLLSSSLAEYLVPAASDVPSITLGESVTPSPTNPLGVKGVGEAGTIGAAPCIMNAVVDALSGLGVQDIQMPASPLKVWNAIQEAQL